MLGTRISNLYHYPVKGLSAQALEAVSLKKGEGFPFDRIYAMARHDSDYDAQTYKPLPKGKFFVLLKEASLASLKTHFDCREKVLTIHRAEKMVLRQSLEAFNGRENICRFFAEFFGLKPEETPILAEGEDGKYRFTDISVDSPVSMNAISLINLNSVRALGKALNEEIDPLRFRANSYFEGLEAFQELEMLGKEINVGTARLKIFRRTRRCAATNVNPITAERDMNIPYALVKNYKHADMGVYAEVLEGGEIKNNMSVTFF